MALEERLVFLGSPPSLRELTLALPSAVLTLQRRSWAKDSTRLVRKASLGEASVNTKMSERGGVCSRASWQGGREPE